MDIAEQIDGIAGGPVLLVGSPPPEGSDLDLLLHPAERERVEALLAREQFTRRGHRWARFRDCGVEVVDLFGAEEWHLPEPELNAVFSRAVPVGEHECLVRPVGPDELLVLSRRVAPGMELSEPRRSRIDRAVSEQPHAWEQARARACAWGVETTLELLEASWRSGAPLARSCADQRQPLRRQVRRAYDMLTRKDLVVTLSGLDGAGKSSQAQWLKSALESLGYEVVVVWARLTYNPSVEWLAGPTKDLLYLVRRLQGHPAPACRSHWGGTPEEDPGRALRQRSRLVTEVWTTYVALANALTYRREIGRHTRRGRVVICDRFVLDSITHLRFLYGQERDFRFQIAMLRLLSPTALLSYLLDVAPETAIARKKDWFGAEELRQQAHLYRREARRLGVRVLDGEQSPAEVAAMIARDVWAHLP